MAELSSTQAPPPEGSLPPAIVEAIAISNAKSIGEQPAILANLALANQVFHNNLQQQMLIAQQQAINQIRLAVTGRCIKLLLANPPAGTDVEGQVERSLQLLDRLDQSLMSSAAAPKTSA
ncbi:MAG TPA: FAD-binding monooxygenase [Verrucomicrobiae bacterium]|nr:FAD-binding monooxygenase [Verrucomicrobiae bacterium]